MVNRKAVLAVAAGALAAAAIGLGLGGCRTTEAIPVPDTASAAEGQKIFANTCSRCHTTSRLRGHAGRVRTNMGSISSAMRDVKLTDEDVANVKAFIRGL